MYYRRAQLWQSCFHPASVLIGNWHKTDTYRTAFIWALLCLYCKSAELSVLYATYTLLLEQYSSTPACLYLNSHLPCVLQECRAIRVLYTTCILILGQYSQGRACLYQSSHLFYIGMLSYDSTVYLLSCVPWKCLAMRIWYTSFIYIVEVQKSGSPVHSPCGAAQPNTHLPFSELSSVYCKHALLWGPCTHHTSVYIQPHASLHLSELSSVLCTLGVQSYQGLVHNICTLYRTMHSQTNLPLLEPSSILCSMWVPSYEGPVSILHVFHWSA